MPFTFGPYLCIHLLIKEVDYCFHKFVASHNFII